MEENKKDVLPLEGEPLTAPQISEPVVNALAAALSKIETYVPTQYIDDGPPDIDADHLNHAEQAIMRVTNLANGAADAIAALQSQVTQLNNNLGISQGIFTDVADIVSDSNLYYEKIGPHLLYITGWIEIKPGTYNASYQIFKMDEYKAKINTMLHAIDVTKLTSPVYPIYVANDTGIASLKLNQTLTSSLNLQITSFIVV